MLNLCLQFWQKNSLRTVPLSDFLSISHFPGQWGHKFTIWPIVFKKWRWKREGDVHEVTQNVKTQNFLSSQTCSGLLSHFVMRGKGWKGQFSNQIYMMHMWYHHKFLIHVLEWDSWIFLSNQSIVSFLHQRQGLFCSCSHENREQNSNLNGRAASHLMLEQTNRRSYDRCWFAKKKKY